MSWGAVIVGGATLLSSQSSKSASKDASRASSRAGASQVEELKAARLSAEERLQPFVDVGEVGAGQLTSFLENPMQQLEEINPLVDFLRNQGFEQIQESAAAQGRLGAGGTLKDLTSFNTGLASTIVPNLQQQKFNQLFSTTGLGSNAAAGQATAALNTGSQVSNVLGSVGRAQSQNAINQGNIDANFANNAASFAGAFPSLFGGGQQKSGEGTYNIPKFQPPPPPVF